MVIESRGSRWGVQGILLNDIVYEACSNATMEILNYP